VGLALAGCHRAATAADEIRAEVDGLGGEPVQPKLALPDTDSCARQLASEPAGGAPTDRADDREAAKTQCEMKENDAKLQLEQMGPSVSNGLMRHCLSTTDSYVSALACINAQ
jgi:hypothetical protein